MWHRFEPLRHYKDYNTTVAWTYENVGIFSLMLILIVPVMFRGTAWQRVFGGLLCIHPLLCLAFYFYDSTGWFIQKP